MYEKLSNRSWEWSLDRRTVLKSAAALVSASAVGAPVRTPTVQAQMSTTSSPQHFPKPQIGFTLAHEQFTVPQLIECGVAAEQAGFDLVSLSDHFQPWQANEGHCGYAWVTMSALGQRTQSLRMGTAVTCPTFRYPPAVVAEAFATLGLLYPGRIYLGVGSGEALNEQAATGVWPKWAERSKRLVEATDLIRDLWSGKQVNHQGKYYQVNARLYDVPSVSVPIFMAGNGPKAVRRSAHHGDGLITDPKTWKNSKEEFLTGARAAGKDPGTMPIVIEHFDGVGDKKDAEAAAQLWRFLPKAWNPYFNFPDPRMIEEHAAKEVPLEQVYADWPISTDPEVHAQALLALFHSGATAVLVHSGQPDQRHVIEFYGKHVLPSVRRQLEVSPPSSPA